MKALISCVVMLLLASPVMAEGVSVKVTRIIDGDTVEVLTQDLRPIRVRLADIDAPEKAQPFGRVARDALARQIYLRQVELEPEGSDRYGRLIAVIRVPDTFFFCGEKPAGISLSINEYLVCTGMAWAYRQYLHDPRMLSLEAEARAAHRGLWADAHPVPPWVWRKAHH